MERDLGPRESETALARRKEGSNERYLVRGIGNYGEGVGIREMETGEGSREWERDIGRRRGI